MRRLLFIVALAAACSSNPKPGGDGGSGGSGGAGGDLAMSGPPDLLPRSTVGVACGPVNCAQMTQICCTADSGKTGDCQPYPNATCGTTKFHCDGPEDCPPADPECCVEAGIAECRTAGYCAMRALSTQAYLMCHTNADCGSSAVVCKIAPGSPYGLCLAP